MAHMFVYIQDPEHQRTKVADVETHSSVDRSGWAVAMLAENIYSLRGSAHETLRPGRMGPEARTDEHRTRSGANAPLLMKSCDAEGVERWIVIDAPGSRLRVNGIPLVTGVRALHHRDELRMAGVPGRAWFSLECQSDVAPFDGPQGTFCPRCKIEIDSASLSVRCPQCRVYYHQSTDSPCWTYAETCAHDNQPTDLDANFRWTPEEFERHD
jgi:hypothetical protein